MTQTVVITGASAGIVRAAARLYGARGASVGLIARGQAGLDGAAKDVIDAGGQAFAVPADVADPAQVEKAATEIEAQFGPIDVHAHSGVNVTVVQMPAVNTPQFSWVLSRLPRHPRPVPPIYQPEVAAHGVLYAADHPRRKQYWVGGSTAATLLAQKFAPALLDHYLAKTGFDSQQTDQEVPVGSRLENGLGPAGGLAGWRASWAFGIWFRLG